MNNTEKQAGDWLDTFSAPANALGGLFLSSGNFLNNAATAAGNFATYGTTNPRPETVAARAASLAAQNHQKQLDAQRTAKEQLDAKNRAALGMGKDFYTYALGGLGAGIVLTRLQQVLSGANKPKPQYTKFGPGPHDVDDEEKIANDDLYTKIVSAPGRLIQGMSGDPKQQEWLTPMLLTGAGAGLYSGYSIMSQIAEQKRKADLKAKVEEAKKQYQKALMGKKVAADLDAAFGIIEKSAKDGDSTAADTAAWLANKAFDPLRASGAMPWYLAGAVVAPGLLSAKMMYDWTRARSKDKALADARKTRARLAGSAPIYVDPEQLAAIKRVAS